MSQHAPDDTARVLARAAEALRRDTAFVERVMREKWEAADPLPGVAEPTRLADLFAAVSKLSRGERAAQGCTEVSREDLAMLRHLASSLAGPSMLADPAERHQRAQDAADLDEACRIVTAARNVSSQADV